MQCNPSHFYIVAVFAGKLAANSEGAETLHDMCKRFAAELCNYMVDISAYSIFLPFYFIIESYSKYTQKRRKKKEREKQYTIKHHTVGLVCVQKTNNVIYSITEIAR